jgi:hypothetical protein
VNYVDLIRQSNDQHLNNAISVIDACATSAPPLIRSGLQQWVDRQAMGLGVLVPNGWVDEAADVMIQAMNAVLDYCRDGITLLRQANEYLGSPDTLRAAADALGALASNADGIQIDKSRLAGWLSWDDPPANRLYEGGIDAQDEPLNRVSTTANSIAGALDQHANDIENFYLQLAAIVVGATLTYLGVVSAILGIVGALPTGGISLAASIVGLISALIGIVSTAIGVVQMIVTATQGTAGKLDALPSSITTWEVPPFAIVQ